MKCHSREYVVVSCYACCMIVEHRSYLGSVSYFRSSLFRNILAFLPLFFRGRRSISSSARAKSSVLHSILRDPVLVCVRFCVCALTWPCASLGGSPFLTCDSKVCEYLESCRCRWLCLCVVVCFRVYQNFINHSPTAFKT